MMASQSPLVKGSRRASRRGWARLILTTVALVLTVAAGGVLASATLGQQKPIAAGKLNYVHPLGGWSVQYPSSWFISPAALNGAAFTSYDPTTASFESGVPFESALATPPNGDVRIQVEVWPNSDAGAVDFSKDFLSASSLAAVRYRAIEQVAMSVAGERAEMVKLYERGASGVRIANYWFFPSAARDRMFVIRAWPSDSALTNEVQEFLGSFRITSGIAGVQYAPERPSLYVQNPPPTYARTGGPYIGEAAAVTIAEKLAQGPILKREVRLVTEGDIEKWLQFDMASVAKDRELYLVIVQAPYRSDRGTAVPAPCRWYYVAVDATDGSAVHYGCPKEAAVTPWPSLLPTPFGR